MSLKRVTPGHRRKNALRKGHTPPIVAFWSVVIGHSNALPFSQPHGELAFHEASFLKKENKKMTIPDIITFGEATLFQK